MTILDDPPNLDAEALLNQHLATVNLSWSLLQTAQGTQALDAAFLDFLQQHAPELLPALQAYRTHTLSEDRLLRSQLLIDIARLIEPFLATAFGLTSALSSAQAATTQYDALYTFREMIVARKVRRYRRPITDSFDTLHVAVLAAAESFAMAEDTVELRIARYAVSLLADERDNKAALEQVVQWAKLGQSSEAGQAITRDWMSFRLPRLVEPTQLVPIETIQNDPYQRQQWHDAHSPENPRFRQRCDFSLSDKRASVPEVQAEIDYCKYCHDHEGDFCARGFFDKKGQLDKGFRRDYYGQALEGCPLEEKISEMQWLKREGLTLAALAMAMADNPMIPATGHRICNDCMKSCIYQKQDPVDVPQIETRILTDVLALPWGAELYHLLRRWNPLRAQQYYPESPNSYRVLIVGMGPAGFSLAHHLLMAGCTVVGIDGLKIEPIRPDLVEQPIVNWADCLENLDSREMTGFGGVAEYGITSRWDKNFLKLIYFSLARESQFSVQGGVRFGGTVTIGSAWQMGFDHIALATGAGHPKVLEVPNGLATGMRQANDFLMALQLTGAAKADSLAKLQIQLPALVIGGGLTAIDTATEVGVYYLRQIERLAKRYAKLVAERDEPEVRAEYTSDELAKLDRFLAHATEYAKAKAQTISQGTVLDTVSLIRRWGGVTMVYRKRLHDSPAYRRNHEEVEKALQEGIYFRAQLTPIAAKVDAKGNIEAMEFAETEIDAQGVWQTLEHVTHTLAARSIFVATGTTPNTVYAREHPETLASTGNHYVPHYLADGELKAAPEVATALVKHEGARAFLTSYHDQYRFISFLGDAHPQYQGTVVKAITSAQHAYPEILHALEQRPSCDLASPADFGQTICQQLTPVLVGRKVHHNGMIELHVRAPIAARAHQIGQIYRLQSYEQTALARQGVKWQLPPMALSAAGVIGEQRDILRLLISPSASQHAVIASLPLQQPIILLGPTGAPIALPKNGKALLLSMRWGQAVVLELAKALCEAGNEVRLIAVLERAEDDALREELLAAAHQVTWLFPSEHSARVQPYQFAEHIESILLDHQAQYPNFWQDLDYWHITADTDSLQALQTELSAQLADGIAAKTRIETRIASPMQCMLKGVCGQCLQWLLDPETGEKTQPIFACAAPDQQFAKIDFAGLRARQRQDHVMATLNRQWLER